MDNNEILLKTAEKEKNIIKENLTNIVKDKNKEIERLKLENELIQKENEELRKQLDSILYSRSYKFTQKIKKIIKK